LFSEGNHEDKAKPKQLVSTQIVDCMSVHDDTLHLQTLEHTFQLAADSDASADGDTPAVSTVERLSRGCALAAAQEVRVEIKGATAEKAAMLQRDCGAFGSGLLGRVEDEES